MKKTEKTTSSKVRFFGIPRLFPYLRRYKGYFALMFLFTLAGTGVDILLPLYQRYAINHFVGEGTLDTLHVFITVYVVTIFSAAVVNFISTYYTNKIEVYIGRDLRSACFSHIQKLSFSYFNQNSVGYIHARVMSDTSRIGSLVSWTIMDAIWQIGYVVGAAFVMITLNARLASLVLVVVPVLAVLVALFQGKLTALNRKIRETNSKITGNFNEGITGAKTIKTLTAEEKIYKDFAADTDEMHKTTVRASRYHASFGAIITFASSLAIALVLWRGGIITMQGVLEIGTLSVFVSYAMGIMEPVRWLIDAISSLITTKVNIERVTDLIGTVADVSDTPEVIEKYGDTFSPRRENWEELCGDIEFRDVTFKYPDGDEYIFEHFDLKIPLGTNVAIVGETGAGKSTLVNLVCRFFEVTDGELLIDGKDVRERSQLWLHSNIGYVLQSPHLFSGSVRENLLYGNPGATDEEIWEALRRVSADEIVNRMENGLDSDVGEGGDALSGGEKQLISFARALLASPKILVLDEATASIDTITEQKIQSAIGEIVQGRTSFVIAHRLSTIRHADIILVVDGGKIVERGTHDELMALKGKYFALYTRQFEEERIKALFDTDKE